MNFGPTKTKNLLHFQNSNLGTKGFIPYTYEALKNFDQKLKHSDWSSGR